MKGERKLLEPLFFAFINCKIYVFNIWTMKTTLHEKSCPYFLSICIFENIQWYLSAGWNIDTSSILSIVNFMGMTILE